jgi:hypothetical protein
VENVIYIDILQTIVLCIVAGVVVYALLTLRREFFRAGQVLRDVFAAQQSTLENLDRAWKRIEENTAAIDALRRNNPGR